MDIKTVNTILYCNRWDETVSFYRTKLKLQETASHGWFVEFRLNECSRLSVADAERTSVVSSGGKGLTISMNVDDIHGTHASLKKAGLNPTAVRNHPWGAKVTYVYDPEGNRLEFWSGGMVTPVSAGSA